MIKLISAYFSAFVLVMSFSLSGMEEKHSRAQKALVATQSPASPRRKNKDFFVVQGGDRKVKRQIDFSNDEKKEETKEQGTVRFLTPKDNLPYVMRDAYKEPGLKNYKVDAFVFSQIGVIGAMNDAVGRGAVVDLSVGIHHQNKMNQYKVTTIRQDKAVHGKNIAALDMSPSKGEPKEALFITGSANPTDAVWPTGNQEVIVEVKGDVQLTTKAYQLMRSNSLVAEKNILLYTPDKRDVYSSQNTALNKSRAKRILTVADSTDNDRILWLSTMNFNDQDMADALSKTAESGADTRLTVNKTALTKHGIPLLKDMADKGVKVRVFYPNDGSRKIQHTKELIRNDLYVVSNANFTDEGDSQKNLETYFPHDEQLINYAKQEFERFQEECVTLDKALTLLKETAEKKKAKAAEKKEAEEKKSSTKKRKKVSGPKKTKQSLAKKRKTQSDNK